MLFTTEDFTMFKLGNNEYPLYCDIRVLEKIQEYTGDIIVAEDKLRGFQPRVDKDGMIDRTIGNYTLPDLGLTCNMIKWMLDEAQAVTNGLDKTPTLDDIKIQNEYTLTELAIIAFKMFEDCISGKKKNQKEEKKTDTETQK